MRPGTRVAIAALFVVLLGAAAVQLWIASSGRSTYPGPIPGTPLPTATP